MTDIAQKPSVSIYWDVQNVNFSQEKARLLLDFGKSKGRVIDKKVYYNSLYQNQARAKDKLQNIGFRCIDVPCPLKNSADNQLKSDLIDDVDNNQFPNIVILVSGDGDFAACVSCMKKLGIKVIILAQKGNIKQKLKQLADEFYFVEELPKSPKNKNQPQKTFLESGINYNQAIEYLIEAIKTALNQSKRTVLGYINNLMRELFPNYQGVSCIRTPDNRKFSSFSKFVEAVVNEGKIRRQNEELLLIE